MIELHDFGLIRVNTKTFEQRRVYAPGFRYGKSFDPKLELAVSDDGTQAAMTGINAGIDVFTIDETCGDTLQASSVFIFRSGSIPCTLASIDRYSLFPGFKYAFSPRFSDDGDRLLVSVRTTTGVQLAVMSQNRAAFNSTQYIGLGDSFSSGEGESSDQYYQLGTVFQPHGCHVSSRSYPYIVAAKWNVTAKNVACSGAQLKDLVASEQYQGQNGRIAGLQNSSSMRSKHDAVEKFTPGIVPQSVFLATYLPKVASIGAGGNDAGLMSKLSICLMPGTCEWAKEGSSRLATAVELQSLFSRLKEVYKRLKGVSPGTTLVAIGYPQIMSTDAAAVCPAVLRNLINYEERVFTYEAIKYTNDVIKAAALSEGVKYVDISTALDKEKLCDGPDAKGMSAVRLGDDIAPVKVLPDTRLIGAESFHPTPFGHELIAAVITKSYPVTPSAISCSDCLGASDPPAYGAYWTIQATTPVRQSFTEIVPQAIYKAGDTVKARVKDFTVLPNSVLRIEIHSEPSVVAELTSSSTGSLLASIEFPPGLSQGFHTIHIFGNDYSGQPVDLYQVVFVENDTPLSLSSSNTNTITANDSLALNTVTSVRNSDDNGTQPMLARSQIQSSVLSASYKTMPNLVAQTARHTSNQRPFANWVFHILYLIVGAIMIMVFVYVAFRLWQDKGG